MNAQSAKKLLTSYAWITVGSLLYALAFDWFYAPNQIALGGITGLGQAIHTYIPFLSVGLFVLLVNIPLFLLGWRFIGGHLLASSLYAMALSSVAMDGLNLLFPFPATDPMLAAVCGGALLGLAAGLIFSKGATTGGTDLIARLLKLALPWLSMGKVLLAVDVSALLLVSAAYGSINAALYGLVAQVAYSSVTDTVLYGLDKAKVAYIITQQTGPVVEALTHDLGRGVTLLHGQGAWSGQEKQVLMCAFKQRQIVAVRQTVKELDPDAFLIVCDAREVLGRGFTRYKKNAL